MGEGSRTAVVLGAREMGGWFQQTVEPSVVPPIYPKTPVPSSPGQETTSSSSFLPVLHSRHAPRATKS